MQNSLSFAYLIVSLCKLIDASGMLKSLPVTDGRRNVFDGNNQCYCGVLAGDMEKIPKTVLGLMTHIYQKSAVDEVRSEHCKDGLCYFSQIGLHNTAYYGCFRLSTTAYTVAFCGHQGWFPHGNEASPLPVMQRILSMTAEAQPDALVTDCAIQKPNTHALCYCNASMCNSDSSNCSNQILIGLLAAICVKLTVIN